MAIFCGALFVAISHERTLDDQHLSFEDRAALLEDPTIGVSRVKQHRILRLLRHRRAAVSQLGICAEIVLEGALGGAGYTLAPMLTSTVITASRIPLAAWAALHWGSAGVWWAISLTALGRAVAMLAIWRAGRWKASSIT